MLYLTDTALNKIALYLQSILDHGLYYQNGVPTQIPIYDSEVSGDTITIYLELDENVSGDIEKLEVIDTGGAVLIEKAKTFNKVLGKGLLVSFTFSVREVESS